MSVARAREQGAGGDEVPARRVLRARVHVTSYPDAVRRIVRWALAGESRAVCATSVHGVVESTENPAFEAALARADLVTPDGMPVVWALRLLGAKAATRVYGPDLMPLVCAEAERLGLPIGLYGSSQAVLDALAAQLRAGYPALRVAYAFSPPFRDLTPEEDAEIVRDITRSGTRILFVGLGCPKQERWVADHKGRVAAVMVAVGAAFDFMAGTRRQAPRRLQRAGLEWLFRLATEPKRLWRRYLHIVPRFTVLFGRQWLAGRLHSGEE